MKYSAGFIGVGNMGSALLDAVSSTGDIHISIYDADLDKAAATASDKGVEVVDIATLASQSEFVFLGVKPNVIGDVAKKIKQHITNDTIVVSMAAGIDLASLVESFGTNKVIRIMPNTPVAVNQGMVLYCTAADVKDDEVEKFGRMMCNAGKLDLIEEKFIDAAAAISGCGPAFVYMFAEALADGAVKCGLPRDKALTYAKQTILGSGAMMVASGKHPEQLKDEVCSPGGTTIEGVLSLEKGSFRYDVSSAVISAYEKTSKLKK